MDDNHIDEMFLQGLAHKNSFAELKFFPMVRQTVEVVNVSNALVFFLVSLFSPNY
jgi:hypothetical protein